MKQRIKARDVTVGMIIDKSLDNEVFSVKQAYLSPATGTLGGQEMVIRGPLGIVIKRDADAWVTTLVRS